MKTGMDVCQKCVMLMNDDDDGDREKILLSFIDINRHTRVYIYFVVGNHSSPHYILLLLMETF